MDNGYVNARVRGMYSRLLDRKTLNELILKPDIRGLITALEATPYREDLERALITKQGLLGVEEALRLNFIRTVDQLAKFLDGEPGLKYITIFSSRWDVHNIKTILRGKKIQTPSAEIVTSLVPLGRYDEPTLNELVKQPDIKAVIDLLATWGEDYAAPLTEAFPEFVSRSDLVILEIALDRYYYQHSLSLLQGNNREDLIIRDLIAHEIDLINLKSVMMMVHDHIDPEDALAVILVGGKKLDMKIIRSLIEKDSLQKVIEALDRTPYQFLNEYWSGDDEEIKISTYQHLLDEHLIRHAIKLYRGDPLSVTITIGYLWAKYNEVMNLRIIARCKSAHMPPEDMEAEMIYV